MDTHTLRLATLASLLTLAPLAPAADESKPAPQPDAKPAPVEPNDSKPASPAPAKAPAVIRYKPPVSGAPAVRATGGTRAGGEKGPSLDVLAPEHLAFTSQAQPTLYWYQSQPAQADFELTITEPKKPKPVLAVSGGASSTAGIHSIPLSKHKVSLATGVAYQWSVAIIPDPSNRSKDILAKGMIKRLDAPADLLEKAAAAEPAERAVIFAQAGYWYDALQAISTAIAARPKDKALHALRASLLEQAKLPKAAAADR